MLLEFFLWWKRQLASLLPAAFWAKVGDLRPRLILRVAAAPDGKRIIQADLHRNGRCDSLGDFVLTGEGLAGLKRATRELTHRADITLELDDGSLLDREMSLPAAVRHSLTQALAYEFDHQTPFRPDEVYWMATIVQRDRQNATLSVRLAMILKRKLDPLLDALRQAGLKPRQIVDGNVCLRLAPAGSSVSRHFPAAIAAAAVLVLCLTGAALPFAAQSLAMSRNTTRIAQLEPAAREVQALRQQLGDDVRDQQISMGDPLVMLAALTDALPDDTRLVGLSLHERTLELVGQSSASSLLIGRLAKSTDFENPTFSAPVTRPENSTEDTFSIKVQFTQ